MKLIIFAALVAVSLARPEVPVERSPDFQVHQQATGEEFVFEKRHPLILRDERVQYSDGRYSFDFETEDGIKRTESGSPLPHANNAIGQIGTIEYPLPDGQIFTLKFVANENGFQPESPFLPVAPAFPHPIPQFVLDQIEFARLEKEEEARRQAEEFRRKVEEQQGLLRSATEEHFVQQDVEPVHS